MRHCRSSMVWFLILPSLLFLSTYFLFRQGQTIYWHVNRQGAPNYLFRQFPRKHRRGELRLRRFKKKVSTNESGKGCGEGGGVTSPAPSPFCSRLLDRYVKTTWTFFPPPRIRASWQCCIQYMSVYIRMYISIDALFNNVCAASRLIRLTYARRVYCSQFNCSHFKRLKNQHNKLYKPVNNVHSPKQEKLHSLCRFHFLEVN